MAAKDQELLSRLEALANVLPNAQAKCELYACAATLLTSGAEIAANTMIRAARSAVAPLFDGTLPPREPDRSELMSCLLKESVQYGTRQRQ